MLNAGTYAAFTVVTMLACGLQSFFDSIERSFLGVGFLFSLPKDFGLFYFFVITGELVYFFLGLSQMLLEPVAQGEGRKLLHIYFIKNIVPYCLLVGCLDFTSLQANNGITIYKGMLPCFLRGNWSTLFSNILKARNNFLRVSLGWITSSIKPREAAW